MVGEAGAIVVIDRLNPLHHVAWRMDGGEYRQIAALGVSAHQHIGKAHGENLPQIRRRIRLGGHLRLEGHVEVLPPADERVVRPAKRHIDRLVIRIQQECGGGELLLALFAEPLRIVEQAHAPEPFTPCGSVQQLGVFLLPLFPRGGHRFPDGGCRLQRHRLSWEFPVGNAVPIEVGKAAEDQVIHRTEWRLCKRQVATPQQIVEQIGFPFYSHKNASFP